MELSILLQTALFRGCTETELQALQFRKKQYRKGEMILSAGASVQDICIVLNGTVQITRIDICGNANILSLIGKGQIFAEAYACVPEQPLLVEATAQTDCEVLFFPVAQLSDTAPLPIRLKILQNLVRISAAKNLHLSQKIFHTSAKTIRGRVLSYLSQLVTEQRCMHVSIPFDRQGMADYLNLDRSALSKELSAMQRDGLISFSKNQFTLHIEPQTE